ncbi:hypothetical protein MAR_036191, partial [Mya arenaria]
PQRLDPRMKRPASVCRETSVSSLDAVGTTLLNLTTLIDRSGYAQWKHTDFQNLLNVLPFPHLPLPGLEAMWLKNHSMNEKDILHYNLQIKERTKSKGEN